MCVCGGGGGLELVNFSYKNVNKNIYFFTVFFFWERGTRVSENPNLKKNFFLSFIQVEGWEGGTRVSEIFSINPNLR